MLRGATASAEYPTAARHDACATCPRSCADPAPALALPTRPRPGAPARVAAGSVRRARAQQAACGVARLDRCTRRRQNRLSRCARTARRAACARGAAARALRGARERRAGGMAGRPAPRGLTPLGAYVLALRLTPRAKRRPQIDRAAHSHKFGSTTCSRSLDGTINTSVCALCAAREVRDVGGATTCQRERCASHVKDLQAARLHCKLSPPCERARAVCSLSALGANNRA